MRFLCSVKLVEFFFQNPLNDRGVRNPSSIDDSGYI